MIINFLQNTLCFCNIVCIVQVAQGIVLHGTFHNPKVNLCSWGCSSFLFSSLFLASFSCLLYLVLFVSLKKKRTRCQILIVLLGSYVGSHSIPFEESLLFFGCLSKIKLKLLCYSNLNPHLSENLVKF